MVGWWFLVWLVWWCCYLWKFCLAVLGYCDWDCWWRLVDWVCLCWFSNIFSLVDGCSCCWLVRCRCCILLVWWVLVWWGRLVWWRIVFRILNCVFLLWWVWCSSVWGCVVVLLYLVLGRILVLGNCCVWCWSFVGCDWGRVWFVRLVVVCG